MARGDKDAYTDKQKRQAGHIEEGYEDRGVSSKEAKARAWATVNKEIGRRQEEWFGSRQERKSQRVKKRCKEGRTEGV